MAIGDETRSSQIFSLWVVHNYFHISFPRGGDVPGFIKYYSMKRFYKVHEGFDLS